MHRGYDVGIGYYDGWEAGYLSTNSCVDAILCAEKAETPQDCVKDCKLSLDLCENNGEPKSF